MMLAGCVGFRSPSAHECSLLGEGCAYSSERSVDGRLHHFLGEGMFVTKQSSVYLSKVRWLDLETGKHIETAIPCRTDRVSQTSGTSTAQECERAIDITDHVDQLPGHQESIFGKISL
jgi:hypothetical protein